MMCEACTGGRHYACGLQTWCECDCDPNDPWSYLDDPADAPENQFAVVGCGSYPECGCDPETPACSPQPQEPPRHD